MIYKIPRCYDSHLHLSATGEMASGLKLHSLTSLDSFAQLAIERHHFRGDWLVGFGWDQHEFNQGQMPTRQNLDQFFPNFPVYFIRRDGHAVWINSKAFDVISQKISLTDASGVYLDAEMAKIGRLLPTISTDQKMHFLKEGIKILNQAGFTHVRDMSCDETQWNLLTELEQKSELSLYIENNLSFETVPEFERLLGFAAQVKNNPEKHFRLDGMKFYVDGALGSEGAGLSQNYQNSDKCGLQLWEKEEIEYFVRKSWEYEVPVSIHALGDRASAFVTDIAYNIWQTGLHGKINIEHAEVMSTLTIQKLAGMNSVVHMQPSHWLSDKVWIKQKLGSLMDSVFPWAQLEKANVQIQWGSDAPIENPSLNSTLLALEDSQKDAILGIQKNKLSYHSHHEKKWGENCFTEFDVKLGKIQSIIFDGKPIFLAKN